MTSLCRSSLVAWVLQLFFAAALATAREVATGGMLRREGEVEVSHSGHFVASAAGGPTASRIHLRHPAVPRPQQALEIGAKEQGGHDASDMPPHVADAWTEQSDGAGRLTADGKSIVRPCGGGLCVTPVTNLPQGRAVSKPVADDSQKTTQNAAEPEAVVPRAAPIAKEAIEFAGQPVRTPPMVKLPRRRHALPPDPEYAPSYELNTPPVVSAAANMVPYYEPNTFDESSVSAAAKVDLQLPTSASTPAILSAPVVDERSEVEVVVPQSEDDVTDGTVRVGSFGAGAAAAGGVVQQQRSMPEESEDDAGQDAHAAKEELQPKAARKDELEQESTHQDVTASQATHKHKHRNHHHESRHTKGGSHARYTENPQTDAASGSQKRLAARRHRHAEEMAAVKAVSHDDDIVEVGGRAHNMFDDRDNGAKAASHRHKHHHKHHHKKSVPAAHRRHKHHQATLAEAHAPKKDNVIFESTGSAARGHGHVATTAKRSKQHHHQHRAHQTRAHHKGKTHKHHAAMPAQVATTTEMPVQVAAPADEDVVDEDDVYEAAATPDETLVTEDDEAPLAEAPVATAAEPIENLVQETTQAIAATTEVTTAEIPAVAATQLKPTASVEVTTAEIPAVAATTVDVAIPGATLDIPAALPGVLPAAQVAVPLARSEAAKLKASFAAAKDELFWKKQKDPEDVESEQKIAGIVKSPVEKKLKPQMSPEEIAAAGKVIVSSARKFVHGAHASSNTKAAVAAPATAATAAAAKAGTAPAAASTAAAPASSKPGTGSKILVAEQRLAGSTVQPIGFIKHFPSATHSKMAAQVTAQVAADANFDAKARAAAMRLNRAAPGKPESDMPRMLATISAPVNALRTSESLASDAVVVGRGEEGATQSLAVTGAMNVEANADETTAQTAEKASDDESMKQYQLQYPPQNRPQLEQYLRLARELERLDSMGGISEEGARHANKNLYANWTNTNYNVKERYLSGMRVRIIGNQLFYSPEPPELRQLAVKQPLVFEHMFSIVAAHALSFLTRTLSTYKVPNVDFTVAFGDFCLGTTRLFHDAWGSTLRKDVDTSEPPAAPGAAKSQAEDAPSVDGPPDVGITEAFQVPIFQFTNTQSGRKACNVITTSTYDWSWWGSNFSKGSPWRLDSHPPPAWKDRVAKVMWRGTLISQDAIRSRSLRLGLRQPELFDIKVIDLDCEKYMGDLRHFDDHNTEADCQAAKSKFMPMEQQQQFKYTLDMDGGGTTFRLKNLLLGGFLVFKVDTDTTQFWFDSLRPYVHYVPVSRENFEQDLVRKLRWAIDHDADAERIAANAHKFAVEHLGETDAHWQQQAALSMYAQRQTFIPVGGDAEMQRFCCKDATNVNLMKDAKFSSDCIDLDPACKEQAVPKEMLYSTSLHEPVVASVSTLEQAANDLSSAKDVLLSIRTNYNVSQATNASIVAAMWDSFADAIKPFNLVEGHVMQDKAQAQQYAEYAMQSEVATICETGFGAGHSALLFLLSNPSAHVYSFDIANYKVTMPAVEFLTKQFPTRFTFIQGDSQKTMPEFRKAYPGVKCDLSVVDGGHVLPWVNTDLLNFWHMAKGPDSMVIMSDTPCNISWCTGPTTAWNAMVAAAAIAPSKAVQINEYRGYSAGVFSKRPGSETALATLPVAWTAAEPLPQVALKGVEQSVEYGSTHQAPHSFLQH